MLGLRLTPGAVQSALKVAAPQGLLTLVLRSRGLLYIENLEYTQDAFSAIDLTDNEITELSGLPELRKLEVLLLANNNIASVGRVAASALTSLLLMNNSLSSFAEVAKLRGLRRLEHLVLLGNRITEEHHYRGFVVWLFPTLKVLDCQKVKPAERRAAAELFGPAFDSRLPAADALLSGSQAAAPVPKDTRLMETTMRKLLAEEKALLAAELEGASSMAEIERISRALKRGYVGTAENP
ncbi:L domain-like protein [Metschnikowia bicuspidata var. bicuspidata NRRL YB-4993]|uniref:U2 small nuclear ribonucleoprotein A' n=1 Tax=Metschnikowia bicuspidata var. bicuspidata NRRL YB-4993 TaxID=869754 RepID=A0A1A0HCE6_9ASCO|nr:L domain-like protein [Metschnikowia bicuspidata var. bicuspidata NRRL YB-4993]OBA21784.1 L domain-like protein [Metschnikowia bicuspidata var. bicuspidata NRRL YB-4993]